MMTEEKIAAAKESTQSYKKAWLRNVKARQKWEAKKWRFQRKYNQCVLIWHGFCGQLNKFKKMHHLYIRKLSVLQQMLL
jgi:hypothetical protein